MFNSLQSSRPNCGDSLMSSSRSNNWETLDIKHYIHLYPQPYMNKLTGQCIPMNINRATLAELSEVPVDLDPVHWSKRKKEHDRLCKTLNNFGSHLFRHLISKNQGGSQRRACVKFFRSLEFYRKSYRKRDYLGEASVHMATAFETLLTDHYAPRVSERVIKEAKKALRGVPGVRKMVVAIKDTFDVRNKYVHGEKPKTDVDLSGARQAFVSLFLRMAPYLNSVPKNTDRPIKTILRRVA